MKNLQHFKKTDIGFIPLDWDLANIDKSCTLKARIGWQGLTIAEYLENGDYFLVTGTDFKNGYVDWKKCVYVDKYRYVQDKNIQLKNNDILLTKDGTIGKVAFVDNITLPSTLNSGVFVIRIRNDDIYEKFLYYLLKSFYFDDFLRKITAGSTITHLYQKDFVKFNFVLPSLAEQQKIAQALTDADNYISALEKLIEKKKMIKEGLMVNLLTGKQRLKEFAFNADGTAKGYKDSELGKIPEDWEVKTIEQICDVIRGASPRPKGDKRYYGGNIPRLMVEDVTRDGKFVTPKVDFLTEEGAKLSRPCPKGTLTLVCSGTVGVPSILNVDACIHDGFLALSNVSDKASIDYLYHFFCTQQAKFDNSATHGGVFTNLTTDGVKNFEISLPTSYDEQLKIANIFSETDIEINGLNAKLTKLNNIKQGMMQKLLTGEIRLA